MSIVIAPDGVLLGVATSGVDAHLRAKSFPGSRVWRASPNSVRRPKPSPSGPCERHGSVHKWRQLIKLSRHRILRKGHPADVVADD